ncbi:MAG: hypothetical protein ABFC57_12700 [Veillonellales bacterium]
MDISLLSPDMIAFGPDILSLIEIEIEARRIPYKQIAADIHTATGTIASWVSRGSIPADKLWNVIAAIGSPKLWLQAVGKIPGNIFHDRYLDGMDSHPVVLLDESIDIAAEFIPKAKQAKTIIRHKKAGYRFAADEEQALRDFEDSLADILAIGKMTLVQMEEHYDRPIGEIMNRQGSRMKERGYVQDKEKTAPARAAM